MKTAMVWGASGGIGTALVKHLVDAGWRVVGVARDPGSVTYLASDVVAADVEDPESVLEAVERAGELVEDVHLWVYAVGDITSVKVESMAVGDWERIVAANLSGAYRAIHYSLPLLVPDAHLVFIGAVSERLRLPGLAAYAAAKAGLEAFAEVLWKEQRGHKVTVLRPKAVETQLWEKVPFRMPPHALAPDDLAQRIIEAYRDGQSGVIDL